MQSKSSSDFSSPSSWNYSCFPSRYYLKGISSAGTSVGKCFVRKKIPGWEGVKGLIKVIEFQKRGLPHVHILVILDRSNTMTANEVKKYNSRDSK